MEPRFFQPSNLLHVMRPMFYMSRGLGLSPFYAEFCKDRYTFKISRRLTIFSLALLAVMSIWKIFAVKRFLRSPKNNMAEMVFTVCQISFYVRGCISHILRLVYRKDVVKLLTRVCDVEWSLTPALTRNVVYKEMLKAQVFHLVVVFLVVMSSLLSYCILLDESLVMLIDLFSSTQDFLADLQFVYLVTLLKHCFCVLNDRLFPLEHSVKESEGVLNPLNMAQRLLSNIFNADKTNRKLPKLDKQRKEFNLELKEEIQFLNALNVGDSYSSTVKYIIGDRQEKKENIQLSGHCITDVTGVGKLCLRVHSSPQLGVAKRVREDIRTHLKSHHCARGDVSNGKLQQMEIPCRNTVIGTETLEFMDGTAEDDVQRMRIGSVERDEIRDIHVNEQDIALRNGKDQIQWMDILETDRSNISCDGRTNILAAGIIDHEQINMSFNYGTSKERKHIADKEQKNLSNLSKISAPAGKNTGVLGEKDEVSSFTKENRSPHSEDNLGGHKQEDIEENTLHLEGQQTVTAEAVRDLARNHAELCRLAEDMNGAFSLQLLVSTALMFVEITYLLYVCGTQFLLSDVLGVKWASVLVPWLLTFTFRLYGIAATCSRASLQAAFLGVLVHKVLARTHNSQLRDELQLFSLQLLHRKVQFTACGFFPLDFTLIYSIVGAVTTYLVILIQFQLSLGGENDAHTSNTNISDF